DRSFADRLFRQLIFALFPYPGRMRLALAPLLLRSAGAFASRSRPAERPGSSSERPATAVTERSDRDALAPGFFARVRAMLELAPSLSWRHLRSRTPERTPAVGERRLTVGLLTGCVQRVVFPQVNEATVNVLSAEGCDVVAPREQGCCGALALHAGRLEDARTFARATIDVFQGAGVERIAVNAAGCGSSMKEYGQLLAGDPVWADRARAFSARVRDVSEIVSELGEPRASRQRLALKVAYHDACHLAHAQGVRQQPPDLLK